MKQKVIQFPARQAEDRLNTEHKEGWLVAHLAVTSDDLVVAVLTEDPHHNLPRMTIDVCAPYPPIVPLRQRDLDQSSPEIPDTSTHMDRPRPL